MTEVLQLLLAFTRVGLLGFGGGPSMIPLIEEEVVGAHGWLTPSEFLDAFAFGNALPGPIATKLAGYVGFEVAGLPGAVVALLGVTAPTIVLMLLLASLFRRVEGHWAAAGFLGGVRPMNVALLALVIWQFAPSALLPFQGWFQALPLVLAGGTALLTLKGWVHPAVCIAVGGAVGLILA